MKRSLLLVMVIILLLSCTACGAAPVGSSAQSEPYLLWDIPWDIPIEDAILLAEERSGISFTPSYDNGQQLVCYYGSPDQKLMLFDFPIENITLYCDEETRQLYQSFTARYIPIEENSLDVYTNLSFAVLDHLISIYGLPSESSYMRADLFNDIGGGGKRFNFPIQNGEVHVAEFMNALERGSTSLSAHFPNLRFYSGKESAKDALYIMPAIFISGYSPAVSMETIFATRHGESLGNYTECLAELEP